MTIIWGTFGGVCLFALYFFVWSLCTVSKKEIPEQNEGGENE